MIFSREFAFSLFINYGYIHAWMHVHRATIEINSSPGNVSEVLLNGLKWERSVTGVYL